MKISEVSRIPISDVFYVEFHSVGAALNPRNMHIPAADEQLKYLLDRDYIVFFPPMEKELKAERDDQIEHHQEIPANLFYGFKYRKYFYLFSEFGFIMTGGHLKV